MFLLETKDILTGLSFSFAGPAVQELNEQLHAQGKVETRSLDTLVSILAEEKLRTCEELDVAQYEKKVEAWEAERIQLIQREEMMKRKAEQEHLATKTSQAVQ